MFTTFFLAELKYTLKQPMVYIFLVIMALLTFGATASDSITIGGAVGNVFRNSPYVISIFTTTMTLFGLIFSVAFFNNAALRDHNNLFHEIVFSTPIKKSGYFFGRFLGALVLSTLPMIGIFVGIWLGTITAISLEWVAAERFGEFQFSSFVINYFLFILPNMFIAGAIIYALSQKFKSTVISFVAAMLVIVTYMLAGTFMSDIENEALSAVLDTFCIRAYMIYTKYFTIVEKNTLSPSFGGILLLNRIIWISFGLIVLIASYWNFSFKEKNRKVKKSKIKADTIEEKVLAIPSITTSWNKKTLWLHFKSFFSVSFWSIARSATFKILFLFSIIILLTDLIGKFEYYGLQSYPLTYKVIDSINNASTFFIIITLLFFSGELVWRDRLNKIHEVIDATPHISFISLIAKSISLLVIASTLYFFLILCGVTYQLISGYSRLELDVYLLEFFYTSFFTYFIWGCIAILIQVLSKNRYIGYFFSVMILFFWEFLLEMLDIKSNMLSIGGGPEIMYSDMNRFDLGLLSRMWFNLYWALFALIALLLAGAFWSRGVRNSFKAIFLKKRNSRSTSYKWFTILTIGAWVGVAAFVYYNTQILHAYNSEEESDLIAVNYEKKYKKYQHSNLPKISDSQYFIDIYPDEKNVQVKAKLKFVNESKDPIDSIHFTTKKSWKAEIKIPSAKLVLEDKKLNYSIYKLATPIAPGGSITAEITSKYTSKGFSNFSESKSVLENGTFINNAQILPYLGYRTSKELKSKRERKKYDLAPRKKTLPELTENCTSDCKKNYLTRGKSDLVNVETIISTSKDQIAIAPGSLVKKWSSKGRNYFKYKLDHPSQNYYSFMSARYQVASRKWNGIDIEVYYHKDHEWNVEKMLDAAERTLAYGIENFGPYYHKQCRIIEFPRYHSFAQAFPGTMPYSESLGFVIDLEDKNENNIVDAVIAHEIAHQWWAHQLIGAYMQGATMLSESFSEYTSLMTMKHLAQNPMKMTDFLKYNHDRYLNGRGSETSREDPLIKVKNQSYIHYGKGSLILYALQEYIGEEKVNNALRNFLNEHKYKEKYYPTSLDFMKHLEKEIPDSLQYLVQDWFKEITLYDNRMQKATYRRINKNDYEAKVNIKSYKIKADSQGKETKVAMDDWVDIGFFEDEETNKLIFKKRVKINQADTTYTFRLTDVPLKAVIDPYRLLIDRVYNDNTKTVEKITSQEN